MNNSPSWEQQLEDIYQFARLHHWVSQLNELIEQFVGEFSQNYNEISRKIHASHLSGQQNPADSLVSLVLLHKFQTPVLEITEKLFHLLYGKLDSKDQQFLILHFFKGMLPLSTDDSHEIIIRSFISYKRAIFRGMQIENLVSNVNPAETALFFTVLICRVDVHTQNRALINLLLYRIEARLPENVLQGVLVYLKKLRQVIYEVYTRGEKVLSDELNISEEPDLLQIEDDALMDTAGVYEAEEEPPHDLSLPEKAAGSTASGKSGSSSLEPSNDDSGGRTAGEKPGGMDNPRETSVRSPESDMAADRGRGEPTRGQEHVRQGEGFAAAAFAQDTTNLQTHGSADNTGSSGDFDGLTASVNGPASGALDGAVLQEPETGDNNIFQVAFNRSIEKLLDLLGDAGELPVGEEALLNDETDMKSEGGTGESNMEKPHAHRAEQKGAPAASGPARSGQKKRFGIGILISLGAIVLLSVVLFVALGQGHSSEPVAAAPAPAVTAPAAEPKPVLPEIVSELRQLPDEQTSSVASEGIGGNSINPDIKVEDGNFLWRVQEGESVWKMYIFARGGSGIFKLSVDVSWGDFLEMFRNLNPMLRNPDVIYPDNLLRLPGNDAI